MNDDVGILYIIHVISSAPEGRDLRHGGGGVAFIIVDEYGAL